MTEQNTENQKDLYAMVTEQFIGDFERGVIPWQQPWTNGESADVDLPLRLNGIRYRGINALLLWAAATAKRHFSPVWMTYDQAKAAGGQVRRGERGTMIVSASRDASETGGLTPQNTPLIKRYTVFNTEQIDGLSADSYPEPPPLRSKMERLEAIEALIRATGAVVSIGDEKPFYDESSDVIQLPGSDSFEVPETYYAISLRELVHWTKHKKRLDRKCGQQHTRDRGDTSEGLVAEIGAAFLCAELGIAPVISEDRIAYGGAWLGLLKEDNRAIFRAAALAQRAADYLTRFTVKPSGTQADASPPPEPTSRIENPSTASPQAQKPPKKTRRRRTREETPAPQ